MASFWDEFKDLFKTDSQREEEHKRELAAALEAEKEVTDKLAALDREYRDSLPEEPEIDLDKLFPESLGLEKVEHTPATDEELAARAQAGVDSEKTAERQELEHSFGVTEQKLDDRAREAQDELADNYRELGELYDELRRQAGNDAIARGVARSSILTSARQDLHDKQSRKEAQSRAAYDAEMSDIGSELESLRREQDAAFEQLDLKYAAELEERIARLKEERDETARRYAEYNNEVEEKEHEYAVKREEDIAEYLKDREKERLEREEKQREEEKKYGYTGEKQENYAKRYDIAFEFYSSLSPDIAADALAASPSMKYYLGNYYEKLMGALGDSSSQTRYF